MSFPTIPDITPSIDLTLEDSINLLLSSVALEEVSLSKLMDAETSKILCVLKDCEHKDSVLQDAIKINESVDTTIKNMIKMQMLLQFKLENIKEFLPTTTTTTTTTTSTSTTTTTFSKSTTTTHTTTSTTSTCSTTTKRPCKCCLTGKGKGCVSNRCDEFYLQTAVLKAFEGSAIKNRSIRYSIEKNDIYYMFYASAYNIDIERSCEDSNTIIVYGNGYIKKQSKCSHITDLAKFILIVCEDEDGCIKFKMEIKAKTNPELSHNSGVIKAENYDINLPLGMYC